MSLGAWVREAWRLRALPLSAEMVLAMADHWQALTPDMVNAAGLHDLERLATVLRSRQGPRDPWGKPPRGKGKGSKWSAFQHLVHNRIFTIRNSRREVA